jgi:hypothetical protein
LSRFGASTSLMQRTGCHSQPKEIPFILSKILSLVLLSGQFLETVDSQQQN